MAASLSVTIRLSATSVLTMYPAAPASFIDSSRASVAEKPMMRGVDVPAADDVPVTSGAFRQLRARHVVPGRFAVQLLESPGPYISTVASYCMNSRVPHHPV
jgi:hypothetical protein